MLAESYRQDFVQWNMRVLSHMRSYERICMYVWVYIIDYNYKCWHNVVYRLYGHPVVFVLKQNPASDEELRTWSHYLGFLKKPGHYKQSFWEPFSLCICVSLLLKCIPYAPCVEYVYQDLPCKSPRCRLIFGTWPAIGPKRTNMGEWFHIFLVFPVQSAKPPHVNDSEWKSHTSHATMPILWICHPM